MNVPAVPVSAGHRTLVEARHVFKAFGQTPALRGASVAVRQGEILAVMGPSGSGKSTLLHCLAGIFTPDNGEALFDGQALNTMSEADRTKLRRTAFGFVFQFGQLVPELTAADNVALPLLLNRTKRKVAYKTADTWLDRLGIGDKGRRRTGELSGGESQRVAVARALALAPKVIFADEPTGSLDGSGDLAIYIGYTPAKLNATPGTQWVTSIYSGPPQAVFSPFFRFAFLVGVLAVVFPVLVLISTATRLAADRREERFAALRLVGGTPGDIRIVATVEAAISAFLGAALGAVIFLAVRPALAGAALVGTQYFESDLTPTVAGYVAMLFGAPIAAARGSAGTTTRSWASAWWWHSGSSR